MEILDGSHNHRRTHAHAPRGTAWRVLAGALAVALTLMLMAAPALAQRGAKLDELKAAFVFQFANFAEWPEDAFENDAAPLVICIVGNDAMADLLEESVEGKNVAGHPLEVVAKDRPGELDTCHIVFFDAAERRIIDEALEDLTEKPVLTVSDADDFTRDGGVIRLYQQTSKLRIEVNIDAAERAHLKISSKLLSLARVVREESDS